MRLTAHDGYVILGILVSFILVMACSPLGYRGVPAAPAIFTGTQGLSASFIASTPPGQVLEGGQFDLMLELQNKGAYDIDDLVFSIGTNEEYISLREDQSSAFTQIKGKSLENPNGDKVLLNLKGVAGRVSSMNPISTPVSLTFCYSYQTSANPMVCMDTDLANQRSIKKACSLSSQSSVSTGGGQGAPVTITRVETGMLGHDDPDRLIPHFKIFLSNAGGGQVIDAADIESYCGGTPKKDVFNIINVKVRLQDKYLVCSKDVLTLKSADTTENYVECELPEGISRQIPPYTAPLSVTLDYGYAFTITRSISVAPRRRD